MVSFSELMIGGISLVTAVASGYGAVEQARYRQAAKAGDDGDASTVRRGSAAACRDTVTAPLTGESVLVSGFTVEKEASRRAGKQRLETTVEAVPFRHEGSAESVEVDPTKASFSDIVVSEANETEIVARSVDDLSEHARDAIPDEYLPPEHGKRVYTQVVVPEGDVTVVGGSTETDDGTACSGVSQRVAADGATFQVSDLPPEDLREQRSLGSIAFRAIVAIAGFALAAVVFLT